MRGWFAPSRIFSLGKEFQEKELNKRFPTLLLTFIGYMMSDNHYDRLRSLKTYFGTIYEKMCDLDMKDQKKKWKGTCGPV